MFKIKRKTHTRDRDGISIIEVLTSMAVATIGVFGVMVMIPFAVKQSQTGLDNDAANALGRNAGEEFQINGLLQTDRVSIDGGVSFDEVLSRLTFVNTGTSGGLFNCNLDRVGQAFPATGPLEFNFPGVIHFDPIGFAGGLTEFEIDPLGEPIKILSATANRLTSLDLNGDGTIDLPAGVTGPYTTREASRLCRSADELFHEDDNDNEKELAPPQPLFDFDGANQVKRQFSGRISWSTLLVPEKDPGLSWSPISRYRSHTIVYRDRFIDPTDAIIQKTSVPFNPDERASSYEYYLTNMSGSGFDPSVSQITFAANVIDTDALFRGDWVMLVNRIPIPDPALGGTPLSEIAGGARYRAAFDGHRTQVMFARVTRVSANSVTVDGGSFDFTPAGIPVAPPTGVLPSSETYMVHLKNVVNVYERSVSVEK
jgi:hypothetical protein